MRAALAWLGGLPVALACAAAAAAPLRAGDVLVLDGIGTTLYRVDVHAGGVAPFSPVGPNLFDDPVDVAVDGDGRVLVVNAGDGRVVTIDPATGEQSYAQSCHFDIQLGLVCEPVVFASAPGGIESDWSGGFLVTTAGGVRRLTFSPLLQWGVEPVADAAGVETGAAFDPFSNMLYFVDGLGHVAKLDVATGQFSTPFQSAGEIADVAVNPYVGAGFYALRFPAASGNCLVPTAIMGFDLVFHVLFSFSPTVCSAGGECACPRKLAWTPFTTPGGRSSMFVLERRVGAPQPPEILYRYDESADASEVTPFLITDSTQIGTDARALAVYVPEAGAAREGLAAALALAFAARARRRARPPPRDPWRTSDARAAC